MAEEKANPEQGATGEPSGGAPALRDFIQEFAQYLEPAEVGEVHDYLDIGLPTATGTARAAQEAADFDEPLTASAEAPAAASAQKKAETEAAAASLGRGMSLDQLDALMQGNVVGASLQTNAEGAPAGREAGQTQPLGAAANAFEPKAEEGPEQALTAPETEGDELLEASPADVEETEQPIQAATESIEPPAAEAQSATILSAEDVAAMLEGAEVHVVSPDDEGPVGPEEHEGEALSQATIDAILATAGDDAMSRGAIEEDEAEAADDGAGGPPELSQAEIDALFGELEEARVETAPVAEKGKKEFSLEARLEARPEDEVQQGVASSQSGLDVLAPARQQLEQAIVAEAAAAAAEEPEESDEEVEVIRVGGRSGPLGLPVFVWGVAGVVSAVLVVALVGYSVLGRGGAPPLVPAETPTALVEQAAATPEAEATIPPATPTVAATPEPARTATPSPVSKLELPRFVFGDAQGDGIDPNSGLLKPNLVPAADILSVTVDTSSSDGSEGNGTGLTADGFAGPAAGLDVVIVLGGPLTDLEGARYQIDLFGRFKTAAEGDLAPAGTGGLEAGSQMAIHIAGASGQWTGDQVSWSSQQAPIATGPYQSFAIQQNRIRLVIPTPLLSLVMPTSVERDDFQFFVRVAYFSDSLAVSDEAGRGQALEIADPKLSEMAALLADGKPTQTPEQLQALDDLQLKLLRHAERRTLALMSVSDAGYRLAEPIAR